MLEGQVELPSEVNPPTLVLPVRGHDFTLTAMAEDELLDFAEILIQSAREKVRHQRLPRDAHQVRKHLRAVLIQADIVLICRVLNCNEPFARSLTVPEREVVIDAQFKLNGLEAAFKFFNVKRLAAGAYDEAAALGPPPNLPKRKR